MKLIYQVPNHLKHLLQKITLKTEGKEAEAKSPTETGFAY